MIIDKLNNVSNYSEIPSYAVEFIKNLTPQIAEGRYELVDGSYANIESYNTKSVTVGKFEAHKNYADIQLLLVGAERIYYTDVNGLEVLEPYNQERDIEFFANCIASSDFLTLDGTNFAMIYPHEAHAPQIAVKSQENVKKVVLKIKM